MEKTWSVYIHTNTINNKKYVGITSEKNPPRRWGHNGHGYLHQKNGVYCQVAIANAILKYGWDVFTHEIISTGLTQEEAYEKEKELIAFYKSNDPDYGYNIENGGQSGKTVPATKEKSLNTRKGYKHSPETKRKISESNIGKHHNDEAKENMSAGHSKPKHDPLQVCPNFMYNEKPCKCVETGICYHSIANAAKSVGSYTANIIKAIRGDRKRAGGYHWEWITEEEYQQYVKNQNIQT